MYTHTHPYIYLQFCESAFFGLALIRKAESIGEVYGVVATSRYGENRLPPCDLRFAPRSPLWMEDE